jgi:hypothetical protein
MEAAFFSVTLALTQKTTPPHYTENHNTNVHRNKNVKSHIEGEAVPVLN